MFLSDDGFNKGVRDQEVYEKLKDVEITEELPNLFRWIRFMKQSN